MKADFVLDYNLFAVERAEQVYLLARIQADAPPAGDRHPLNLSLVLDRSGSMQGVKLEYVQQAAQFLVQRLGADDHLSVVSYNEQVMVDVPAQAVIEKDRINAIIEKLFASGMTNLSGGWLQGCQLVAENAAEGQVNRVLLLSDGLANRGVTDAAKLEAIARQKRAEGITTTTMGVGLEFNEDLLTRIAREGGGAYYFIDDPDQAPAIFEEELKGLLNVVGQNLTVTLTPTQDITMVRQLNAYPTGKAGEAVVFRLGDLFADELKTLLLELTIPALKDLGQVEVAHLRFEYDELGESGVSHRVIELPVWVNIVSADQAEGRLRDPEVVKTALLLEAARAREEAIEHADQGDFERASQVLSQTAKSRNSTICCAKKRWIWNSARSVTPPTSASRPRPSRFTPAPARWTPRSLFRCTAV
jgi:Ca-activated chloride channel family protein